MSNPYDADVTDDAGNVRISGAITFTDPANQPGGGSSAQAGNGPPNGVTVPTAIGGLYIDTTHGSVYIAFGVTSDDWIVVGGLALDAGSATGVSLTASGYLNVLGGVDRDTPFNGSVVISDAYAQWNGNGAGLRFVGNGTDGQQALGWSNGAGAWNIVNAAGTLGPPPGGIFFPSADPLVAGAWWDNAGVLTRSAG